MFSHYIHMENVRSRGWAFTYNNYDVSGVALLQAVTESALYVVYGEEKAPTTGTPHLQGYFYFKDAKSARWLKDRLPEKVSFFAANGSAESNRKYCTKDGTNIYERGTIPKQGKRTDLDEVKETLKETGRMRDIVLVAKSYQSVRMAEVILKYHEEPRDWEPHVRWFYGETGTGKSREALKILGKDCYVAMNTAKWWEGYDGHENVLIDDFRKEFCSFVELLKYLHAVPLRVECKGGSRQFRARNIIITSAYHPAYVYGRIEEDVCQLLRRINEIREFK